MKLADIKTDILVDTEIEGSAFIFACTLHETILDMFVGSKDSKGGIVKGLQGIGKIITNPVVAGLAVGYAIDAYSKYKKNKLYTARFFAKTPEEKRFYEKIINDIMKVGHYKLLSMKYVDGGTLWELRRVI